MGVVLFLHTVECKDRPLAGVASQHLAVRGAAKAVNFDFRSAPNGTRL